MIEVACDFYPRRKQVALYEDSEHLRSEKIMPKIRSASKASRRSSKAAIKETRKSKKLQRVAREPKLGDEKSQPSVDTVSSLTDRVQAERNQLFKALAIVECCKYASATSLELSDLEFMVPVFEAVCDLLNTSAGELGCIADDYRHID